MTQATQNTKQIKIDINISADEDVLSIGENPADTNLRNSLRIKPVFHEDGHVESVTVKDVQGFKGSVPMDEWEGLAWGIELPHYTDLDALREVVKSDKFQNRLRDFCAAWHKRHDGSNYVGYFEEGNFPSHTELITWREKEELEVENVIDGGELVYEDMFQLAHEIATGNVYKGDIEEYQIDRSVIGCKDEDTALRAIFGRNGEHVERVAKNYKEHVDASDYFPVGDIEEAVEDFFESVSSDWEI